MQGISLKLYQDLGYCINTIKTGKLYNQDAMERSLNKRYKSMIMNNMKGAS